MVTHALSFDVEEWFDGNLHRAQLTGRAFTGRLAGEWAWLLSELAEAGVKATFFILGEAAARHPDLVRATADAGHEIASHSYTHELVYERSPADFAADVRTARALLQDLSGQPVAGYRAPSWSIRRRDTAALQALVDAGYTYSSSVFPVNTGLYGEWDAPVKPYRHEVGLLELPPAVGSLRIPYGGGVYWRLAPFLTTVGLKLATEPKVIYLHPWELNPEPAPVPPDVSPFARFVLTHGVRQAPRRFAALLRSAAFAPIRDVFLPPGRWPL
jgi:polysaccharide deacetylase family protein (PEP-CTERM system associated)